MAKKKDEKLPLTCYITVKNGGTVFQKALESVSFADQIIVIMDRCYDGTYKVAEKAGAEIYEWYGSDSMAERRNYAIAYKGDGYKGDEKDYVPEWMKHPIMSKNHPEIRNKYFFYIDHDEVFVQNQEYPDIIEELKRGMKEIDEGKTTASSFMLVNLELDERLSVMTSSPLMRLFKTDPTVHWTRDAQNEQHRAEGKVGMMWIQLNHFGYGDPDYQFGKMWNRLNQLQQHVENNPDDFARIMYAFNNITALTQNQMHVDEMLGYFNAVCKRRFFNAGKDKIKEDMQTLLQGCVRHLWFGVMRTRRFEEYIASVKDIYHYVSWIPDVPYWQFLAYNALYSISNGTIDEYKEEQKKYAKEFIECSEEFFKKKFRNLELSCMSKRYIIPAIMCDFEVEDKNWEEADKYNKIYVDWIN